ncbi:MAG: hypothetical protein FWH17_10455 [Oscillospiraceae bacterium]|nr:hypothetical protein [Oscillospiraceae bacterium]
MKRVKLIYNGKEIISDSFNMKAYRVMYDTAAKGNFTPGLLDDMALKGIIAMFDGTPITEDLLTNNWREFDETELDAALLKVYGWFFAVRPQGGVTKFEGTPPKDPILSIYKRLLRDHGITPSEVDEQDPQLLFDVFGADMGEQISFDDMSNEERELYGL